MIGDLVPRTFQTKEEKPETHESNCHVMLGEGPTVSIRVSL